MSLFDAKVVLSMTQGHALLCWEVAGSDGLLSLLFLLPRCFPRFLSRVPNQRSVLPIVGVGSWKALAQQYWVACITKNGKVWLSRLAGHEMMKGSSLPQPFFGCPILTAWDDGGGTTERHWTDIHTVVGTTGRPT
jgi:hypothetical protein